MSRLFKASLLCILPFGGIVHPRRDGAFDIVLGFSKGFAEIGTLDGEAYRVSEGSKLNIWGLRIDLRRQKRRSLPILAEA